MKNLFASFILTIALIQPFSPLALPVLAESDSAVFETQVKGIYGSWPKGYEIDVYATTGSGLPRNIVVFCNPDNPKLEAAALKAASVMPWRGIGDGNEKFFNMQIGDGYQCSNGPLASTSRMISEERLWAKNLRVLMTAKWGAETRQFPLTNLVAVGELQANGSLTKLWIDSNPKSTDLENKLQSLLLQRGLISSLPDNRRGYPQQFWLNTVVENDSTRKFMGLNGPFLTKLKGMETSRAKAASDRRYALINGYSFWLADDYNSREQMQRSSMPVEFTLAQEDRNRKAENVAKRGDMSMAAMIVKNNPQLLANLKAGKEALIKNDFETAKARMSQCIQTAKTDTECYGSGADLANQIAVAYLDSKQSEAGMAFIKTALAEMEAKQFYCSAYLCIIPLLKFTADAKSKTGYMETMAKSRDLVKAAVANLKPTDSEQASLIVGASMLAPLMLGVGLEKLEIKETDPEGVQAKAILLESMELTSKAGKYCKNFKFGSGSAPAAEPTAKAGAAKKPVKKAK